MPTRIRPQIVRPWIRRPRRIAILAVAVLILTNSSAFAQGCGGASRGTGGSPGSAGTSGPGLAGGMGGGFGNQNAMMQMAQLQRMQQGLFNVSSVQGAVDFDGDHKAQLAARKAFRAAQAEQRKKRLAARAEKQTRQVASHTRSSSSK